MLAAPRSAVLSLLVWLTSFVAIRADDDDDDEDDEAEQGDEGQWWQVQ